MAFNGWEKIKLEIEPNTFADAVAPVIISASRATDIPAFFSKWFMDSLNKGFVKTVNPFNRKIQYVTFKNLRVIVFWSKNPKPLLEYLPELNKRKLNYYFQFTLNDYENEGFEKNLPDLKFRIKTFIELSKLIGKEKIIWRFDPIILTDTLSAKIIIDKIKRIGDIIYPFTEKLVISFVDKYKKINRRLARIGLNFLEIGDAEKFYIAENLYTLNKKWKLKITTCSEDINLQKFNISHNKCIDDELMKRIFYSDDKLMTFLNVNYSLKDKGQRKLCNCIVSKDIGTYNTCKYKCIYCYAVA